MRQMLEFQKRNLEEQKQKGKIVVSETKKQGLPKISNFFRYIRRFGRVNFLGYVYSVFIWLGLNIMF